MKKSLKLFSGFFVGIVNSLIGAGGGTIVVPILKKTGFTQTQAHASAIAVILPLSTISAIMYLITDKVKISQSLIFLPFGIIGSIIGAYILPKVPDKLLRRVFGCFMIWAGIRLMLK